jgi:hypothetical protein
MHFVFLQVFLQSSLFNNVSYYFIPFKLHAAFIFPYVQRCIQKYPDRVCNEIYAYLWYCSLRAIQRLMTAKLIILSHKIVTQLHLVAESYTICSSRSRWPVRKLLDTPSYVTLISNYAGSKQNSPKHTQIQLLAA